MNTERREFVEAINGIVRRSFGHMYSSNCSIGCDSAKLHGDRLGQIDDLGTIARPHYFYDGLFGKLGGVLGCPEVFDPDGSLIVVPQTRFGGAVRSALRYAELYEKIFGKKARVQIVKNVDLLRFDIGNYVPNRFEFCSGTPQAIAAGLVLS